MNDEKTSTEAEQTKPGYLTACIERMKAVLDACEHEVRAARFLVAGMESCQLKWRTLSRVCDRIHDLTSWDFYMKTSEVFHTPKESLDFVTANPPIGVVKDAPTPLDPSAPEMVQGGGLAWKAIKTDTCGIRRANGTVRAWAIRENAGVEVFAKQHFVDGKPSSCWTFAGTVDCEKVIFGTIVGGRNKANKIVRFIRNGLLAARLRLKHMRMNKKVREAASAIAGEKAEEVPNA